MESKPWEKKENETERAYAVFCQYLDLPKRDGTGKRCQTDLANALGIKVQSLSTWFTEWEWESRAAAYDAFMIYRPQDIAELEHRRQFAAALRITGQKMREKATEVFEKLDVNKMSVQDALRTMKLGLDLEEKANRIEQPVVENKRDKLIGEIGELVKQLGVGAAAGLAGLAAGGARRVLPSIEGDFSVSGDGQEPSERGEEVLQLPAVPGEVCEPGAREDVVVGPTPVGEGDTGQ